jgi:hypothetical protein
MADIYTAINKQSERALKKKHTKKKIGVRLRNDVIVSKNNRLKQPDYVIRNI